MRILLKNFIRASLLLPILAYPSIGLAGPLENLQLVGEARLRVFFWRIYDSSFYSATGTFDGIEPEIALKIEYRRNIKLEELIKRTKEEWEAMDRFSAENEVWLEQLQTFLPSISRGDTITLRVDGNLGSTFYYNSEPIGQIDDDQFTKEFLSIWLSEESGYPNLQRQLIGR